MSRPRETFNKKEQEKRRLKKKKDKEQKKIERKANSDKKNGMEEMFAYVDENGHIVSTPPDPLKKKVIKTEDIQISVSRQKAIDPGDLIRKGTVTFFNDDKGYGFIKDQDTQESIFVHINELENKVKEHDKVTFEKVKSPKGSYAIRVKLLK